MLSGKNLNKSKFRCYEPVKKLTVCKSLLNNIKATNPAPIAKGAKLIQANNLPKRSPKNIIE